MFGVLKKVNFPKYVQLNLTTLIFYEKRDFQSVKMNWFLSMKQIQVNCFFGLMKSVNVAKE